MKVESPQRDPSSPPGSAPGRAGPSSQAPGSGPPPASRRLDRAIAIQFLKFGMVGVSNTLITFIIYTVLVKGFGLWYIGASAIGFAVGAVNGFLLNRRWTFQGHVGDSFTPLRWTVVQGLGLLGNLLLIYLLVSRAGLDKLLGQACAIVLVVVLTFFANRAWTFRMSSAARAS